MKNQVGIYPVGSCHSRYGSPGDQRFFDNLSPFFDAAIAFLSFTGHYRGADRVVHSLLHHKNLVMTPGCLTDLPLSRWPPFDAYGSKHTMLTQRGRKVRTIPAVGRVFLLTFPSIERNKEKRQWVSCALLLTFFRLGAADRRLA